MALAETAPLAVKLTLDDSQFGRAVNRIDKRLGAFSGAANRNLGKVVDAGISRAVRALTGAFVDGLEALKQDKVVAAQTAAVLASTGHAAGITADEVAKLADKLSVLDGVQDDVVQNAENMLLTFTNVGKNIFPRVTAAALDMSAALGTDAGNAAQQLGKALQDPIKGIARLTRLGITFTDEQKKQIAALVKQGKLYEAQRIILGEVEKKFKGVAKAQADADPSRRLNVALEKLQKRLAQGLLPVVEKVSVRLTEFLSKPETLAAIQKLGDALASLFTDQNLDAVASGLTTAAKAVKVALDAFNSLPPEVKALAIGALALNKVTGGAVGGAAEAFGKILGAGLQKIFAANVTVIGTNVTGAGVGGGGSTSSSSGFSGKLRDIFDTVALATLGATVAEGAKAAGEGIAGAIANGDKRLEANLNRNFDQARAMAFGPFESLRRLPGDLDAAATEISHFIGGKQQATTEAVRYAGANTDVNIRGEGAKQRAAIAGVKAKQQESLVAFRAGERASLTGNSLQRTANQRLAQIRAKRTSFKINQTFTAFTAVSVRDIDRTSKTKTRVAKTTILSAE